ncbi:hypothetical protein D9M70_503100 [compost metagenome]
MARIGKAVVEFTALLNQKRCNTIANHGRRHRKIRGGHSLSKRHEVGSLDAKGFASEPPARAAEARHDLIDDKENVVFLANALDLRPVGVGRQDGAAGPL